MLKDNQEHDHSPWDYPPDDYPEPPEGYCEGCGKWVVAKVFDFGIGAYEFWGARGVHKQEQWACPHCQGPVSEDNYLCNSCLFHMDDFECRLGRKDGETFADGEECPQFESREH